MDRAERKQAVADYKERPAAVGVYALRIGDRAWVGTTPTLDTIENRIRFSLRMGGHSVKSLQAAFKEAGGADAALTFEALETAPAELTKIGRDTWLKERVAHWREELSALPL